MSREAIQKGALWLLLGLMVFGIFVGGLMTWHHDTQLYGTEADQTELIGCKESATVNCDIVNTSEWSELGGVPIGTLAMAAYGTVGLLALAALRGRDEARFVLQIAGAIAVACSAWLGWVSVVELGYVCAWCLRLYGVNAGILLLSLPGGRAETPRPQDFGAVVVAMAALIAVAAGGERIYRSSLSDGEGPAVAEAAVERSEDAAGPAPTLSFQVKTEDGNDATLTVEPDDAWTGKHDAQVAVVMFGDLECGYCKRSSAEIGKLEATYGDRVLFVFKHYPMDPGCNPGVNNRKHRYACMAAKAAVCAQQQGLFWPFHDLAYKNQHQLGAEYLSTYAKSVGADMSAFDTCIRGSEALQLVRADGEQGKALDIHGTPRIYINGKLYRAGTSAQAMAREIELALGASAADANRSAAALVSKRTAAREIPEDVAPMQTVGSGDEGFRIDTFEAGIADGAATVGKHQIPAFRVSWYEARDACAKAGKRLCTEAEWVSACQGAPAVDDNGNGELADDMIEGTAYPYGDYHERGRCWDGHPGDQFRPVYTGEMPGCATATGVYDLTGNVEEWVGDSPETAVLLGGAWDTKTDHARCYRRNDVFGAGYSSPRTGFRCCAN